MILDFDLLPEIVGGFSSQAFDGGQHILHKPLCQISQIFHKLHYTSNMLTFLSKYFLPHRATLLPARNIVGYCKGFLTIAIEDFLK